MKRTTLLAISLLLAGSAHAAGNLPDEAIMFKDPNCGCCEGHARHLEANGVEVRIVHTDRSQMADIKAKAGVPHDVRSCHTIAMGGYAIEGHVPFEAIEQLFDERPQVDGIGLAGMPSGSPGMPGPKSSAFEVKSFTGGQSASFTSL